MSEFHVPVVRLGPVIKHTNADTLSMTTIGGEGGYPVILRTGEYREGDRAVYVPVGAAVPSDDPRWSFLVKQGSTKPYVEIEAKKLRGVFSMGILTPADPSWEVGREVAAELRITRAEEVETSHAASGVDQNERDPGLMPCYTDIEGLRAYPNLLTTGEEVVVVTKIHGENARFFVDADRLYCGSRTRWKAPAARTAWTVTAERLGLEKRLRDIGGKIGVYGELYGNVSGMKYDATSELRGLRLFDAMDLNSRTYLDYDAFQEIARRLDLPVAPVLFRGPWTPALCSLADGPDPINPQHTREGFVVRPIRDRIEHMGRIILKRHGENYLLKKWKVGM